MVSQHVDQIAKQQLYSARPSQDIQIPLPPFSQVAQVNYIYSPFIKDRTPFWFATDPTTPIRPTPHNEGADNLL